MWGNPLYMGNFPARQVDSGKKESHCEGHNWRTTEDTNDWLFVVAPSCNHKHRSKQLGFEF